MKTSLLNKLRAVPPGELGSRALAYLRRRVSSRLERRRDLGAMTYHHDIPPDDLNSYFRLPDASVLGDRWQQISGVSALFLQHRFDLLGSGWVQVRHGMQCAGLMSHRYDPGPEVETDSEGEWLAGRVNSRNLQESQRIWAMVDANYVPVDWQLDFKSGYRWSELSWAQDVPFGHLPGVDIKVPWELARLQHLPQLAISRACSLEAVGEPFAPSCVYVREFRNVVLDFIATNPPRFGVNWRSAMDAAIRAANILVAYDLFRSSDVQFDVEFELLLKRSMLEHGEFILEHFGWHHQPRTNHYLAHLTGLLFISAYLPSSSISDAWLAFSIQELISEVGRQFHEDGSNFEGSTSYHRLSGEMVVYATALVAGLPEEKRAALERYDYRLINAAPKLRPAPLVRESSYSEIWPFPPWYAERIEGMAEFTMHVTKHCGHVAQVGDNDSGRFLRLDPSYSRRTVGDVRNLYRIPNISESVDDQVWWDEDVLNHSHLVSAAAGLVSRQDFLDYGGLFEAQVVGSVSKGKRFESSRGRTLPPTRLRVERDSQITTRTGWAVYELVMSYPGRDLRHKLTRAAFERFGLYIFRSDRLFLSVRCGPLGQDGRGGHSHNDQLSVELAVDGQSVLSDPGTFIYTPLPELRNRYRSDRAHFGFRSEERESSRLDVGIVELHGDPKGECLVFDDALFIGQHTGFGSTVRRHIRILAEKIVIEDHVEAASRGSAPIVPFHADQSATPCVSFSPGYGKMCNVESQRDADIDDCCGTTPGKGEALHRAVRS
jgi:hypothetical protein